MGSQLFPWPSPDHGLALWYDLRAGRASATADFAEAFLEPLLSWLRSQFRLSDDHMVTEVVDLLIVSLIQHPEQFRPERGCLNAYLRRAAKADLINLWKHQQSRGKLFSPADVAELAQVRKEEDEAELLSFDDPRLQAVLRSCDGKERAVFDLIREDRWRTEEYATVLGITALPFPEQQAEVKRVKDRLMKRLKRAVEERP